MRVEVCHSLVTFLRVYVHNPVIYSLGMFAGLVGSLSSVSLSISLRFLRVRQIFCETLSAKLSALREL